MAKKGGVSRRDFLKGAAAGTGTVALMGLGAKETQAQTGLPQRWDLEADVIVVGFGGAGACAAIESHDAKAQVLILEKQGQEKHFSNTRMSGGIFHNPDPTGDRKALKEYAKAMFSGENLPWKSPFQPSKKRPSAIQTSWINDLIFFSISGETSHLP